MTDLYIKDLVPAWLTFAGVPLSTPLVGTPIIVTGTTPSELIREGITLWANEVWEMIVRFTIDDWADLPNVVNEAKVWVANTDPAAWPVCEPYVTGQEATVSSGTVVPLPPEVNPNFDEDLVVSKIVVVDDGHPVDDAGNPIFYPGDEVTFQTEVCYNVDPLPAPDKFDIYVDESYPSNLQYVSDTAPVAFDTHLVWEKLIWRAFPIDPNDAPPCVTFDTTYIINNIEWPIWTSSNIGTTDNLWKNGWPIWEVDATNNSAWVLISTEGRDLAIAKRISAINWSACGWAWEVACPVALPQDKVTFELEYTLLQWQPRTDIVVMDPFPIGNYVTYSSSPTATNELANGWLDMSTNPPNYSLPDYSDSYIYWNNLSLTNPGDSGVVEFTVELPTAKCSPQKEANIAYVSIDGVADGTIMYPITADPLKCMNASGAEISCSHPSSVWTFIDPNLNYLDSDTEEVNTANNISNLVTVDIPATSSPECERSMETDLSIQKESDAWASSVVYPGQIVEYTFTYENDGDGRGYVYLDDRYDPDQLEFIEVVSTGNLLEATESPFFDRWNSQDYIDNQYASLYPYYMEKVTNSADYLTNTPTVWLYNDHPSASVEDSINYYCFEQNPEFNWLSAQAVDLYRQWYVTKYQSYLGAWFDKDTASMEATAEIMWDIKLRVDANFSIADYQQSIYDCIYQGQLNYGLSQGLSQAWAANVAQAYVDDPNGIYNNPTRWFKENRWVFMQSIFHMNNIYIDSLYGWSSRTRDSNTSFYYEAPGNYQYSRYKNHHPVNHWLGMWALQPNTLHRANFQTAMVAADLQFNHASFYQTPYQRAIWYRHNRWKAKTTYSSYRQEVLGSATNLYLDGMNDFMFWDISKEYSIPQRLVWSIGQWFSPTPEYQWNTSVYYPDVEALMLWGAYNTTGSKYATSSTTEYWAWNFTPTVFQTAETWGDYDSIALHNLYAGTDSTNTVTYRFKVKETITENFSEWADICNTALIATNRGLNIVWNNNPWFHNGEYMFWCDAESNLITWTWDHQNFELQYIPFWTGADEQIFCGTYNATTKVLTPYGTNTTLFSRHDLNEEGNQHTNRYHNNIAVKSETNIDDQNFETHCLKLGNVPYDMSIKKASTSNNFVPWALVTYQIEACNLGTPSMPEMYVTDYIPAGLTYAGTLIWNGQWVTVEDTSVSGQITWTIPNVPGTASAPDNCVTLTPQFQISPDFTGTEITNDVEVTALLVDGDGNESVVGDPTPDDNNDTDDISITQPPEPPVEQPPQQAIGKNVIEKIEDSGDDTLGSAWDIVTYQLTFSNNESVTAYFELEDDYSQNLQFISAGTAGDTNIIWVDNGDTVTRSHVEVSPNTTETVLVQFRIAADAWNNEEYTNDFAYEYYAVYECNEGETNPSNNSDTADLPFDLALTKKLDPSVASPIFSSGQDVPFVFEVENQWIIDATDIVLVDDLPVSPSCFIFDPGKNTGRSVSWSLVTHTIPTLDAGNMTSIPLVLTLWSNCQELSLTNHGEIADAKDSNWDPVVDIDSTPDSNLENDWTAEDNVTNESWKDGNDEDDHDIAQIYLEQAFDLAITKSLITEWPYHGGDLVTYEVSVINQWTLDASDVEIIDYILTGFNFDPSYGNNVAEWWASSGANAVATIPTLPVMTTVTKEITVQLDFWFEWEQLMNIVEITEDNAFEDYGTWNNGQPIEDVDSDPDNNPDNDPDGEDDWAPEYITLGNEMDLSLDKSVDTMTSPGPYVAGSTVRFFVDVTNETDIDAYSINVTDYIDPAMFTFVPNNWWTEDGMWNALYTISFLSGLDSVRLPIDLVITPTFTGTSLSNSAEISAFDDDTNPDNEPPTDVDSYPDTDNNNDDDDEDDEDTVDLSFNRYDLALTKTVNGTGPFYPWDTITFDIEVINQGTLAADDVQITDYTPAGLILTWSDWVMSGPNAVYEPTSIAAWSSEIISIDYIIDPTYTWTGWTNRAEISKDNASDYGDDVADIDSMPDGTNDDVYGIDDQTNGDGTDDSDDHDPADFTIEHIYDLALTKVFNAAESVDPIVPGGDITYTITVHNQGTWIADDIEITDYLAPDLILNDADWTLNASGYAVYNTLMWPLPAWASTWVDITVTIDPDFMWGSITNNAEISDDDSEENGLTDIDSTADDNTMNDPNADDNSVDGDGTTDEDDHDPETITVQVYDLALTKIINTVATDMPVYPGDDITYTIEVHNQGTLPASDITVTDYTPNGLNLNDSTWTLVWWSPTYFLTGPIVPGGSQEIDITFTIDPSFTGYSFTNVSEISDDNADEYGTADPDSDPDADDENDAYSGDNNLDGDGTDDEDDSDPAEAMIGQIYDLNLIKEFDAANSNMPLVPWGDLAFTITLTNQGTLPAANIEVVDSLPRMLTLNDSAWTLSWWQIYTTYTNTILPGESVILTLMTSIDAWYAGEPITNYAEISDDDSELYGTTDIDSTPDDDLENDAEWDDSQTDGNGTDDSDDHDRVTVDPQVYDLSLEKSLNTTATTLPVYPWESITYTITVTNDGNLIADDIEVTDYTPAGLILDDTDWTLSGTTAVMSGIWPIVPWGHEDIDITFTIDPAFTGISFTNVSEISDDNADEYDTQDIDSTPDGDDENDTSDDGTDPTSEDDIDPEQVMIGQIYDLNLVKTLDTSTTQTPIVPGWDVTYMLTITNQGTLPATNIELTDTIPTSMSLNDSTWTMSGTNAVTTYTSTILPGESAQVSITMTIDPSYMWGSLRNEAEISDDDSDIYGTSDVDSTPDGDTSDDATWDDNQTDGDGTEDSDDHDRADIDVDVYDLALTKIIHTVATDMPVYPGDDITYTIEVTNQGTLPATNVTVTDYTPTGLILNDATWTLLWWNPTYIITDTIVPGGSQEIDITFTIDPSFTGTTFTNISEISDDNSEDFGTADPDSDPDADENNDAYSGDNNLDGNGTDDEDDSDPAVAMIGQIYDLSLDKAINESETVYPLFPWDDVTYTITVTNEWTLPAADIEITDYTPAGLILDDADWTLSGSYAVTNLAWPILPGESTWVDITFRIDTAFTGYTFTNNAEISDDDSETYGTTDVDSSPDSDPNNGEEDDDDDDVQVLNIDQIYDLALTKTLDPAQLPVSPGDNVTFTLTIENQGTLPASNIGLIDYTPDGLTLADDDWVVQGADAVTTYTWVVLPWATAQVAITYTIDADVYGNTLTNWAEISDDDSELYGTTDPDSDPDGDRSNDTYGADDQTDGHGGNIDTDGDGILDIYDTDDDNDGILDADDTDDDGDGIPDTDDTSHDEDDADLEVLMLTQIYDLSIEKSLNTTATQLPVYAGDDAVFTVEVTNEWTLPAQNIQVTDYVPEWLILNDANWTMSGAYAVTVLTWLLLPWERADIDIFFRISESFTWTTIENVVEISDDNADEYADIHGDPFEDVDSDPDSDAENDWDNVSGEWNNWYVEDDIDAALLGLWEVASLWWGIFFDDENDDIYTWDDWLAWIVVTLYDQNGDVVATTTTDADGNYLFEYLVPGIYSVWYTNSTWYVPDSSAPGTHGWEGEFVRIHTITLAPWDASTANDFGLIPQSVPAYLWWITWWSTWGTSGSSTWWSTGWSTGSGSSWTTWSGSGWSSSWGGSGWSRWSWGGSTGWWSGFAWWVWFVWPTGPFFSSAPEIEEVEEIEEIDVLELIAPEDLEVVKIIEMQQEEMIEQEEQIHNAAQVIKALNTPLDLPVILPTTWVRL